jgi:ABC-type transport system substrate-binding protein
MKRFANYWGTKTATPNLKLLFIPDSTTQVADFEAGTVDIIMPPQSAVSGLKANPNTVVKETPSANITVFEFNSDAAPFNNVDVRRAVALALNRTALAQLAYGGAATPTSDIPPSSTWGTPLSKLPYSTYNPTEAKQLLAEAGYPNGVSTPLNLQYITGYDYGTNALVAAEQSELEAVGFTVTLEPEQTAAWLSNAINSYANMTLTWNAFPFQADPALYVNVFSFEAGTGKGTIPPELTTLTNKALAAPNTAAFEADLNAVESYEDSIVFPRLALLTVNNFVAYPKGTTGVSISPSGSTDFLANVKGA